MKKTTLLDMIHISLFAALTAVGAFINIPFYPVPFTLQFLFCAYAGMLLGAKKGLYSQILYVALGLMGVPIFAKGGGISYIFQPTFGFLIGFIFAAWIIGLMMDKKPHRTLWQRYLVVFTGLLVIYACGVPYLYYMYNYITDINISWMVALEWGFIPYIIPDMLLSLLVVVTSRKVISVLYNKNNIRK